MLKTKPTISEALIQTEYVDIATILHEVKQHGFYAASLLDIAPQAVNNDEAIDVVNRLAVQANLQLSINHALNLCVFER